MGLPPDEFSGDFLLEARVVLANALGHDPGNREEHWRGGICILGNELAKAFRAEAEQAGSLLGHYVRGTSALREHRHLAEEFTGWNPVECPIVKANDQTGSDSTGEDEIHGIARVTLLHDGFSGSHLTQLTETDQLG